ncbi:helix-turn-helix transcriptional regulator [Facilibium subflavum]|uniref:helix-turn-helix transcriptional regulator n=1 Tax=Facilibium subflavum TaxID=2219058 RepID=UPI000E649234|nr:helix-turn-helix transcriptional regulator [Facilibium subflavum]
MTSEKKSIESIFSIRLKKVADLMNKHNIKSYRELATKSGLDPSCFSLAFTGKGKISEKMARAIEEAYNLPLLSLDQEYQCKIETPVYTLENVFDKNARAIYIIDNFNVPADSFYIQIISDLNTLLHAGTLFLFQPIDNIKSLSLNDICLIRHQGKNFIAKYKITNFETQQETFNIFDAKVMAKCIRIEM